ncbi:hypothetical protein RJ639_032339 [Escallonia herrerae]|uniref:Peptidase S8/S53 domain-containing protein n=1 Tax=Escallonia herrerae TaxID=1293975 RepID=A0AA88WXU3_9ASTE|nr:hypothetical protein RJ639_032339 [Escallonia herrerae]
MGFGTGTARGGVPSARIAVYKVCSSDGCADADILGAFDDAIANGVDLISLSLGPRSLKSYFNDSIAIGSFHAIQSASLRQCLLATRVPTLDLSSMPPHARFSKVSFLSVGLSVNTFDLKGTVYPLIYAGKAPNTTTNSNRSDSRFCKEAYMLDRNLVHGKIVFCDEGNDGSAVITASGVGLVMQDARQRDSALVYPLPTAQIGDDEGNNVRTYMASTSNPTATILRSNEVPDPFAPYVVSFSSRSPSPITKDILKM